MFGGDIQFLNLLKWKTFKLLSDSKPTYKHIGERKYHSIDSLCLKKLFWNVKKQWKSSKKSHHSMAEAPSTKMLLGHSYFLDWYLILTTKSRLVCTTFGTKMIENRPCM